MRFALLCIRSFMSNLKHRYSINPVFVQRRRYSECVVEIVLIVSSEKLSLKKRAARLIIIAKKLLGSANIRCN